VNTTYPGRTLTLCFAQLRLKVSVLENQCSALRRELSVVEAELNTTINEDAALVSTLGTFIRSQ